MPSLLIELRERLERQAAGLDRPLPFPWTRLNHAVGGGMRPGTKTLLIGSPGSGKTLVALQIGLNAFRQGFSWTYWPFEKTDVDAVQRLLAILTNDWNDLDTEKARATIDRLDSEEILRDMANMEGCFELCPRQFRKDADGNFFIPECHYFEVLERLRNLCTKRDLVILDPLSMLTFEDGRDGEWKGQERFAKDAATIVAGTRSRLLLVHHTRKGDGKPRPSSLDESAGAAALTRFCDNAVFLEHCADGLESEVLTPEGFKKTLEHHRTLFVAKARDGRGTGWKVACDLSESGPVLQEWGYIQKKAKK